MLVISMHVCHKKLRDKIITSNLWYKIIINIKYIVSYVSNASMHVVRSMHVYIGCAYLCTYVCTQCMAALCVGGC